MSTYITPTVQYLRLTGARRKKNSSKHEECYINAANIQGIYYDSYEECTAVLLTKHEFHVLETPETIIKMLFRASTDIVITSPDIDDSEDEQIGVTFE